MKFTYLTNKHLQVVFVSQEMILQWLNFILDEKHPVILKEISYRCYGIISYF